MPVRVTKKSTATKKKKGKGKAVKKATEEKLELGITPPGEFEITPVAGNMDPHAHAAAQYKQVGNAVPCLFSQILADHIAEVLKNPKAPSTAKAIHKYFMEEVGETIQIETHQGAKCLDFQLQRDRYVLWILEDRSKPKETKSFTRITTGEEVPSNHKYVGTVQKLPYVWHLFEKEEAAK